MSMRFLTLRAFVKLVLFDFYLRKGNFNSLFHRKIHDCRVASRRWTDNDLEVLCAAMDMACIWYYKQVLCFQRSGATVAFLRSYGIPAEMIVAAQQMPFKEHAWVEVNGEVVSDKPYMRDLYTVFTPVVVDK